MSSKYFYNLLIVLYILGTTWLLIALEFGFVTCPLKRVVGIPCCSCGITRSVILILKGEIMSSILMNPLGILLFISSLISSFLLAYDLLFRKTTLYSFYLKFKAAVRKPYIYIPFFIALLANWLWNIYKGI